jgi:GR25 family glycosyltransferase involved in LPS biosynthesis
MIHMIFQDGHVHPEKILSILFSKTICINLDRRPERWQRIHAQLARHGIHNVQRFPAVDGNIVLKPAGWTHTAGAYGCLLSHVEVVRAAQHSNASSVLIFEDDAVLDPDFQSKFASFSKEVPDDWDMLYFGALHKDEPERTSEHLVRITKANSTFAYALKHTVFDAFIELNARAEHVLDMNSYLLQERFNCYCFMPNLAWVEAEYSDVQNRLERHWYLEKSLVLFGAYMDQLLSRTTIAIIGDQNSKNVNFLKGYYEEYFAPLVEIVVVNDKPALEREFLIVSDSDIYLEALDIRANLRILEGYDAATGFDHVIDLTPEQAQLLRETSITRGIDITNNPVSKNTAVHFFRRGAPPARIFHSPNHALRLPRD